MNGAPNPGLRFWQAAITLEAHTPLTVGAGAGDDLRDSLCVVDANGLPTIPGTSLAGALRARWDSGTRSALFGDQADEDGRRSRVWTGWGAPHDATDRPVAYLVPTGLNADDPVLRVLRQGTTRDHVRLSPWGTSDRDGKYDETLVPRGARFTFEVRIDDPGDTEIAALVDLVRSGTLRLGGRTRRGFGVVGAVSIRARTFDLARPADRAAWADYARKPGLAERARALPELAQSRGGAAGGRNEGWLRAELVLAAEEGWRVGGKDAEAWTLPDGKPADLVPVTEDIITWSGTQGRIERQAYLPGSSVKGALRHRTAYHLRCLRQEWREDDHELTADDGHAFADGLDALFGAARSAGREEDVAGRVFLQDVPVARAPSTEELARRASYQQHVSIDRFTAAPLAGHLFAEAMLWKTTLDLQVWVDCRHPRGRAPEGWADLLQALRLAVRDLARGRLPLGAASARGHGVFTGNVSGNLMEPNHG